MSAVLTIPSLLYLVAVVLGMVISVIAWVYPYKDKSFRLLGASVFSLTWALFTFFLAESRLIFLMPQLFQTGFIGTIVYLPFSYLFVRSNLQGKGLKRKDLIHFLPLAVFLVDYSAVYLLSPLEKLQLISKDGNSSFIFYQGWFIPANLHRTLRFTLFGMYSALQFNILLRSTHSNNRKVLYYLAAQFLLLFYYFVYQLSQDSFAWRMVTVLLSLYLLVIAIALILRPRMLYSLEATWNDSPLKGGSGRRVQDFNNEKRIEEICRRLEKFMITESPYLRHGYSLSDLSSAMHIPRYQLSGILNQYKKLSFNDYLNMHRIAFCKERIRQGAADMVTLEALAFECGFNNRNSFTAAFKHFGGTTPSEFLRTQRNSQTVAKES